MITLTNEQVKDFLNPADYNRCVLSAFREQPHAKLAPKISYHLDDGIFINTMPVVLHRCNLFCNKIVSRYPGRTPAIKADIQLYDASTGEKYAEVDGTEITSMRTGAVAALTTELFINDMDPANIVTIGIYGMGETAKSFIKCLAAKSETTKLGYAIIFKLVEYKGRAEEFGKFITTTFTSSYSNITSQYTISGLDEVLMTSDIIISSVTEATELISPDLSILKPDVKIIAIHSKGWQNLDPGAQVVTDGVEQIRGFKAFDKFGSITEMSDIILGKCCMPHGRVLVYNIGIAIHDAMCAKSAILGYVRDISNI